MQISFDTDELFMGVKACAGIAYGIYREPESHFARRMEFTLKDVGYGCAHVAEKDLTAALIHAQQIVRARMRILFWGDPGTFVDDLYDQLCRIENREVSPQDASYVMRQYGMFVYAALNNSLRPYLQIDQERFIKSLYYILASGFIVLREGPQYLPFFRINESPSEATDAKETMKTMAVLRQLDRERFDETSVEQRALSAVENFCLNQYTKLWEAAFTAVARDAMLVKQAARQPLAELWHIPELI